MIRFKKDGQDQCCQAYSIRGLLEEGVGPWLCMRRVVEQEQQDVSENSGHLQPINEKGRRNQEEGQKAAFSKFSDLSPAGSHQVTLIAHPSRHRTSLEWQLGHGRCQKLILQRSFL